MGSVEDARALAGPRQAARLDPPEEPVARAREEPVAEVGERAREAREPADPARRAPDRRAGAEDRLGAQVDALAAGEGLDGDEGLELRGDLGVTRAQPGRGLPLQRGEAQPPFRVAAQEPVDRAVAEGAGAVEEHDHRRARSGLGALGGGALHAWYSSASGRAPPRRPPP